MKVHKTEETAHRWVDDEGVKARGFLRAPFDGCRIPGVAPHLIPFSTLNGWGVYLLLTAAIVFALLARFYERFPGDVALIQWVQSWRRPVVTAFMEAFSSIGKSWILIGLAGATVLVLSLMHRRRERLAAVGVLVILLLTPFLQLLVDRSRPPADLVGINDPFRGLGFPSGHAYQSFVLFSFLIYLTTVLISKTWLRRTVQVSLAILILGIGISRIYLGAHWPSDVLGSYLLGGSFLALLLRGRVATVPNITSR
jgi:undecaprenyl-diphosphatase